MENSQIKFNKEKATHSILYVANKLERRDLHKIFKILYFAERKHMQDWGRPIIGDTYIAMDAGPVPSRVYDILKYITLRVLPPILTFVVIILTRL